MELAAVEKEYEGMLAEREEMKETNKLMDVEVCGVMQQNKTKQNSFLRCTHAVGTLCWF